MGWMPMSFSGDVKDELAGLMAVSRHCRIAEISAIISMCGTVFKSEQGEYAIKLATENINVAKKFQTYIEEVYDNKPQVLVRCSSGTLSKKTRIYTIIVNQPEAARNILSTTKIIDGDKAPDFELVPHNTMALREICCKRAFIRGAFLSSGSISDPEKFYHFEIVCTSMKKAEFVQDVLISFELDARIVQRKKYYVVYIKEGEQIVDLLNIMEAHRALMDLENVRILKEVRNSVNRQVNCETANLNRTVSAAVKQIEDINYIKDTVGLDILNESLQEIAILRVENSETSLKELGEMLSPPVGKSGVNHRLRKISEIADKLRETQN